MKWTLKKRIVCPGCGKNATGLFEIYKGHGVAYDVDGRSLDEGSAYDGLPDHVDAHCGSCDHAWRLRKVSSLADIAEPEFD